MQTSTEAPDSLSKEVMDLLRKDSGNMAAYADASEEFQLLCVRFKPSCMSFIQKPSPHVVFETFCAENEQIIQGLKLPESRQMALLTGCITPSTEIRNIERAAAILILEKHGAFLKGLYKRQGEYGAEFAASTLSIFDDIELQVSALSNLSGLWLIGQEPDLFNKAALTTRYPDLMGVVNSWLAIGFDASDADAVGSSLREAKKPLTAAQVNVELPQNIHV